MLKALLTLARPVLALYFLGTTYALADYQQGLDAYMEGDFSRAQVLWLEASKQKDARSMFNLGLLHQQNKISKASQEQAYKWFRLASDHGYVPAAYHLGLLILNEQRIDGLSWIEKASDQGYLPAKRYLQSLDGSVISTLDGGQNQSLRSEKWIADLSNDDWTIQLLAFNEFAKVEAFVEQNDLYQKVAFFREPSRGVMFFKLIYGSYTSKEAAQQARDSLPATLKSHGPWLRSVADVKLAIAALEK